MSAPSSVRESLNEGRPSFQSQVLCMDKHVPYWLHALHWDTVGGTCSRLSRGALVVSGHMLDRF